MKANLKIAWRNIWRNKRRTLITAASVFFAVFFAILMRSMQLGTYANYINNFVKSYTGYIQIHKKGYMEDKDLNNSMTYNDSLLNKLTKVSNITVIVPRLESFALASYGKQTKGVIVAGISPVNENKLTGLSKKLITGKFLDDNDMGVLVAQKLAKFLDIRVNDTVVLIGQGYHGASAADRFPVRGILHFPAPELDNQMVYMSLETAQNFYSAENKLTSISLNLKNQENIDETVKKVSSIFDPGTYEVMKWDELLVEVVQNIKADNASGLIFLFILYIIIAFGVFGTVLMMTIERVKEFGVMIAVGMRKFKLCVITGLEILYIGMIGIIAGIIFSIPVIYYFHLNPVRMGGEIATVSEKYGIEPLMCFAFRPGFYFNQSLVVIIIVLVAMIFPLRKINHLKIVDALHSK